MAKDADGDYYYDEGTVNEFLQDFGVYEKNGKFTLHYEPNDSEFKFSELALVLESARAPPTTDELPQGEHMVFRSDGSGANSGTDDLVLARNNSGTIESTLIVDASGATFTAE
jgi:hypothetical protein